MCLSSFHSKMFMFMVTNMYLCSHVRMKVNTPTDFCTVHAEGHILVKNEPKNPHSVTGARLDTTSIIFAGTSTRIYSIYLNFEEED